MAVAAGVAAANNRLAAGGVGALLSAFAHGTAFRHLAGRRDAVEGRQPPPLGRGEGENGPEPRGFGIAFSLGQLFRLQLQPGRETTGDRAFRPFGRWLDGSHLDAPGEPGVGDGAVIGELAGIAAVVAVEVRQVAVPVSVMGAGDAEDQGPGAHSGLGLAPAGVTHQAAAGEADHFAGLAIPFLVGFLAALAGGGVAPGFAFRRHCPGAGAIGLGGAALFETARTGPPTPEKGDGGKGEGGQVSHGFVAIMDRAAENATR